MNRRIFALSLLLVFGLAVGPLSGGKGHSEVREALPRPDLRAGAMRPDAIQGALRLRVFEGLRSDSAEAAAVTASSTMIISTNVGPVGGDLASQKTRIEKAFNLKSAGLLTETDLVWEKAKLDKAFHFFRLEEATFLVLVTPVDIARLRFKVEVFEQKNGSPQNLLDTEITIPPENAAIFGFNDPRGKIFFLSLLPLQWPKDAESLILTAKRITVSKESPIPAEGPVRAIGPIKPPKLLKHVDPIYPEIARQAKVEGVVILEAMTDLYGRIASVKILRSIPLLDQAAVDAVRQWVYEPPVIEGRKREMIFTTTVRFTLDGKGQGPQAVLLTYPGGAQAPPKATSEVHPLYPADAVESKIQGTVVLEASVDEAGKVASVKVLRPVHPSLDKAAVDAAKQWTFAPVLEAGKPKAVAIVFLARFSFGPPAGRIGGVMGGVVGAGLPPVRAEGTIQPPKNVRMVEPVYPELARQSKVEGIVILEVMTDPQGRVVSAKVLRSIPLLDQAAIDAVKQWEYEPVIVDGRPRSCVFSATVRFTLK
jgi:protein TonB